MPAVDARAAETVYNVKSGCFGGADTFFIFSTTTYNTVEIYGP